MSRRDPATKQLVRRARVHRAIVVLMIVAAGVLLATPATAGAHVSKKHRVEYKKAIAAWRTTSDKFQRDLAGRTDMARDLANEEQRYVGSQDPDDIVNLLALQQTASAWHAADKDYWDNSHEILQKGLTAFRKRATPWFKTKADKTALKKATEDLSDAFRSLHDDCVGPLIDAEQALAEADLPAAWEAIAVSEFAYEAVKIQLRDALAELSSLI